MLNVSIVQTLSLQPWLTGTSKAETRTVLEHSHG